MPETLPQIRPSFNRSLRLATRPEWLSADTGALVQWELMDRSGLIDWLAERLHDLRHPSSIRYPLSDLLRTRLLLLGQGWRDQSDADCLRQDPSLRVASQTRRGTAALEAGHRLASQPTLSRLLDTQSREEWVRFDRKRKKTSSREWMNPHDPNAKITKFKDGRTRLAHKVEEAVDWETGAVVAVTAPEDLGDPQTLGETLQVAQEEVEAVGSGAQVREVVADKEYHSNETGLKLKTLGLRGNLSETDRGRRGRRLQPAES